MLCDQYVELTGSHYIHWPSEAHFCHQDGYVGRMGLNVENLRRPIPYIEQLLEAARASATLVVFTRQGFRADLADIHSKAG